MNKIIRIAQVSMVAVNPDGTKPDASHVDEAEDTLNGEIAFQVTHKDPSDFPACIEALDALFAGGKSDRDLRDLREVRVVGVIPSRHGGAWVLIETVREVQVDA